MGDRVQVAALVVAGLFLIVVFDLVRRRKLAEEYSLLWIVVALALLALAIRREIIHDAARWLGVYYPPVVLLLVLIVMVFATSLWFSVVMSRQRRQIERLIEETAILSAELRELRDPGPAGAPSSPHESDSPYDRSARGPAPNRLVR